MKISAVVLSLLCIGMLANPMAGSARTGDPETAGQGQPTAPPPAASTQAASTPPPPATPEDYTAYIRPLDKLRTELSEQQALLETVVAIAAKIAELRNQDTRSDFLVLFDEDLSQAERIKAVLSDTGHARSDELASIRAEIEFLKSMYIQTLQVRETGAIVTTDAPGPWAPGPSSIRYVQAADGGTAGFVSFTTGAGVPVVLKADESITIAGKTIELDSVKSASGGRIGIHFVIDGKPLTVYYPQ